MILKLGMQHWVLEYYQVCSNDDPGMFLAYFTARSNLVPYAFVWEKGKTKDVSETIVAYDLKLATDDQSDKKFLLTSKLCPLGAVCHQDQDQDSLLVKRRNDNHSPDGVIVHLPRVYIHLLNHEKNCIKPDFKEISLKLATNG